MAGVQRGGRGKVKFEREARSLGSGREQIPTIALEFYFPFPPLCTSATQGNNGVVGLTSFQNKEMTGLSFFTSAGAETHSIFTAKTEAKKQIYSRDKSRPSLGGILLPPSQLVTLFFLIL